MTTNEAAQAILDWVLEVAGTASDLGADDGIQGGYPAEPLDRDPEIALPDVIVEISNHRRGRAAEDPRFAQRYGVQQPLLLKTWDVQLSIMADVGSDRAENLDAARQLRAIADRVLDAHWDDDRLGARFDASLIESDADYTPGFVRYPDGSTGRDVRISLTVAEIVR